ncbi:hypothetical protein FPV67DRAFT_1703291 [Lyophyllum atratum]|nr:hypothetical protein FPV67DRAFT_1703291 [Lyophyllum atratum]
MSTHALQPTTDNILEQCPRFRILLVGKSGVGKSRLINHAFNVDIATVSHREHGVCDINTEIISPENPRFVLHDSQGFEPSEIANLEKVKSFIRSHGKEVPLKDRLHVVWLCIEVPFAGGRVFETGDEEFLKFASKAQAPVVVVFTKFDKLISRMEEDLTDEELETMSEQDINDLCLKRADVEFENLCVDPLQKLRNTLPYAKTSVDYRSTLTNLIDLTQGRVEHEVEGDVWIVSAMAQRASAQSKISSSIQVGMKQYWQGLASSSNFSGSTLEQCLATIHVDITSSWNFNDPDNLLTGEGFQRKIKALVQLVTPDPSDFNSWFESVDRIGSIISVTSAVVAAAAPAVAAIGLSAAFLTWIRGIYLRTPEVLRCLMGYIVDLTLVMDQLFLDTLPIKPLPWSKSTPR